MERILFATADCRLGTFASALMRPCLMCLTGLKSKGWESKFRSTRKRSSKICVKNDIPQGTGNLLKTKVLFGKSTTSCDHFFRYLFANTCSAFICEDGRRCRFQHGRSIAQ